MAGWISGSESDEEPLNLNLFNRKCFGFFGIAEETVNTFKSIVEQLGGSCDSHPKYVFTTREYYDSLDEKDSNLYNITFIRDCVDANRYLNAEQYRFDFKDEKRDFKDFDPCCNNFHKGEKGCFLCDPAYKKDLPTKQRRKSKLQMNQTKGDEEDASHIVKTMCTKTSKKVNYWEPWEIQTLLDYIIYNNLFLWVKGTNLYRRMNAEGLLTHRTPDSMRVYFCKQILPYVDSYDLPKPIKRKFNQVHNSAYPARSSQVKLKVKGKKVIAKRQVCKKQIRKPNQNNKK
ncbi:uncharacterized protein LOC107980863 [Nasonia vitripennis]|uniref:Uncharacterized protein n=1 Tax=Nasonia vitripennis TaxID=7425 RepID=A0A7M7Q7L4_NASVI|nr:uncharacterized protein LOC107980863 [Nasonia vitripennis]